jgi:hypothetical protein
MNKFPDGQVDRKYIADTLWVRTNGRRARIRNRVQNATRVAGRIERVKRPLVRRSGATLNVVGVLICGDTFQSLTWSGLRVRYGSGHRPDQY